MHNRAQRQLRLSPGTNTNSYTRNLDSKPSGIESKNRTALATWAKLELARTAQTVNKEHNVWRQWSHTSCLKSEHPHPPPILHTMRDRTSSAADERILVLFVPYILLTRSYNIKVNIFGLNEVKIEIDSPGAGLCTCLVPNLYTIDSLNDTSLSTTTRTNFIMYLSYNISSYLDSSIICFLNLVPVLNFKIP